VLKTDQAVDMILYNEYTEFGQPPRMDTVIERPFTGLATRKVLANPILLLLNLSHQFEKTFTQKSIQVGQIWSRRVEEWKNWIENSTNLKHLVRQEDLDPLTNRTQPSVDGLAHALVVAGHLCRRLPQEFQWVTEKNVPDDDSNVFSDPSTSYSPYNDGRSSAQRGPGSNSPQGDKPDAGGSGSDAGGVGRNARASGKRKQSEGGTDCTDMVKEWREQNDQPTPSLLRKLKRFSIRKIFQAFINQTVLS